MAEREERRWTDGLGALLLLLLLVGLAGFLGWRQMRTPNEDIAARKAPQTASAPPPAGSPASRPGEDCAPSGKGRIEVHFDFDVASVRADNLELLEEAAEAYSDAAEDSESESCAGAMTASVDIVGHADSAGTAAYNQRLSERRAADVTERLVARGVPAGAITASGVGENDLAVPTPDNTKNAANRRAVITITRRPARPTS